MTIAEPSPFRIGPKNWAIAEEAAREIIKIVHPTSVSEQRRRDVADFVQRLTSDYLGLVALPYGSVPLKTYLPGGDIDFTVFCDANVEATFASELKYVLQKAQTNISSEFLVKDVQLIRAEVKIVKCMVQNIVVDISFNQVGGLSTLCFFEQIDRLIGKDHLFKRSIILIKSWSYYESRILGAQHSLISTYALETMVLHIFNLYHSTLNGPLAVLHKFLDYFSKFDWETFCVSLNGPVRLSSLPDIIVEMPEDAHGDLLLKSDFLNSWIDMFSVPSVTGRKISRGFQQKHLNIIDPLKEFNNLGRSVSKGNFYRVRSAFTYGARKLRRILLQPENCIASELNNFFSNTKAWNGGRNRPAIQDFGPSLKGPTAKSRLPEMCLPKIDDRTYVYCDGHSVSIKDFGPSFGGPTVKARLPETCLRKIDDRTYEYCDDHLVSSKDSLSRSCKLARDDLSKGTETIDDKSLMLMRMLKINNLNPLIDLSGDYDRYLSWLHFGRWYNENASSLHASVCAKQNLLIPVVAFGLEDLLKNQEAAITYNSNMNYSRKGYGTIVKNGKKEDSPSSQRNMILQQLKMLDISSSHKEAPKNHVPFGENRKVGSCNKSHQLFCAGGKKGYPSSINGRTIKFNEVGGFGFVRRPQKLVPEIIWYN